LFDVSVSDELDTDADAITVNAVGGTVPDMLMGGAVAPAASGPGRVQVDPAQLHPLPERDELGRVDEACTLIELDADPAPRLWTRTVYDATPFPRKGTPPSEIVSVRSTLPGPTGDDMLAELLSALESDALANEAKTVAESGALVPSGPEIVIVGRLPPAGTGPGWVQVL
jgi:hypothetical protein